MRGVSRAYRQAPCGAVLPDGRTRIGGLGIPGRGDVGAEASVDVFPTDAQGSLGEVGRWREQIGLAAISEEEFPREVEHLEPGAPRSALVSPSSGGRQLVAAIVPRGGRRRFCEWPGEAAAVEPRIDAFLALARSEP